jgi:hypothetical protein
MGSWLNPAHCAGMSRGVGEGVEAAEAGEAEGWVVAEGGGEHGFLASSEFAAGTRCECGHGNCPIRFRFQTQN